MATAALFTPLQIGQVVALRTEPWDTATVGVVGGLILVTEPVLVVVRWQAGGSTFESEDTLVGVARLRM
jgi:hypothetical protein